MRQIGLICEGKEYNFDKIDRKVVRGIGLHDGKLIMLYSDKYGNYSFPGGGMKKDESAIDCLKREVNEETGEPTGNIKYHPGWMSTRNAKFSYPLDGTIVHLKLVYDLSIPRWECYKRETVDDEWIQTGTFEETADDRDLSGLKYFGIRVADGHNGDNYAMNISNLIVNGVEY